MVSQPGRVIAVKKGTLIYASLLAGVLLFGALRTSNLFSPERERVRVAGMTVANLPFLEALYQDYFGKTIKLNHAISQASPQLQQVNKAFIPFIENPHQKMFVQSHATLERMHKELFALSEKESVAGAKIILWSEANAFVLKENEKQLIQQGIAFAKKHDTYLLMAMGADIAW